MKRSTFLAISAVLAFLFGVGFLFFPQQNVSAFGIDATPAVVSFARAVGSMLLALGVLNWMVRREPMSGALRAILWANLIIQAIDAVLNVMDITGGVVSPAGGWFGEAVHVLLAASFAYYLFSPARDSA
jgi:hypothetical protein